MIQEVDRNIRNHTGLGERLQVSISTTFGLLNITLQGRYAVRIETVPGTCLTIPGCNELFVADWNLVKEDGKWVDQYSRGVTVFSRRKPSDLVSRRDLSHRFKGQEICWQTKKLVSTFHSGDPDMALVDLYVRPCIVEWLDTHVLELRQQEVRYYQYEHEKALTAYNRIKPDFESAKDDLTQSEINLHRSTMVAMEK